MTCNAQKQAYSLVIKRNKSLNLQKTGICMQQYLRFNEASKGDEKSEYVLAGTLLSLAIALCIGICVVRI